MMGVQEAPARLFYDFDLDAHVPANHILRQIDRFLDVYIVRAQLRPFYSHQRITHSSAMLSMESASGELHSTDISHQNVSANCAQITPKIKNNSHQIL